MSINNSIFALLLLLISVFIIYGSHFDGGSISYEVVGTNGSKLIVRIIQTYTYVYGKVNCTNTDIANQNYLNLGGYGDATDNLTCISNCSTSGGFTGVPIATRCTDYSVGMGITVGQRTDDILLNNGSYFVIADQGSAFRPLNLPGSGGSTLGWSISAVIDLRIRADGTYNTPPKATMISPVYIPAGVKQTISIPTIDADNDNVRCRFASGTNECGNVCPPSSLPTGTSISTNCTLTITGTTAGDWYAVAIQAEDFLNSTTTTSLSSVPVQFLVHVYAQPACTQQPYLYGPTLDGTCTAVQVGVPYHLELYAENYCSAYGVTMVDIATQSFPVVIKTPIVQDTATLWSVNLTWTPTATEVGTQVFCSVGIDSTSVQTNQYCLTFAVGSGSLGTCPGVIVTTEEPTTVAATTEAPTTQAPTTTIAVANTTVANATTVDTTPIVVTVVLIPICCCWCCFLYYFIRPCRAVDVEERKKTVITYTIGGADMYKDHSLLGEEHPTNDNDSANIAPLTDTSYITLHETDLNKDPISPSSSPSMNPSLNPFASSTRKIAPAPSDTTSNNIDQHRILMPHDSFSQPSSVPTNTQTISDLTGNNIPSTHAISYDRYPPQQSSSQINMSSAPATISSSIYRENRRQPIDPLRFTSLSRPGSATNLKSRSNGNSPASITRPTTRPWTKHPRWVVRLSEPKRVFTPPLTGNRSVSKEQPTSKPTSSARSTSTIPRYVLYEE